ncbi:hypothetical protein FIU87_01230 [Bacillus sp. THAF10]|uniref:hypothetical protein n=1 Tax=Bacillus sp. THAF10 TaxID=2587848 RepID=UPI001267C00B|nr:hypothetical protein [Bacillus sp. THAF10]QFT87274.1 hypothetical protein FIU87_01230 [Bacillus sp. THAF10]
MEFIFVISSIYSAPFLWLIFSAKAAETGKRERTNWKGPISFLVGVLVLIGLLNALFYFEYGLAFFPSMKENMIGIIITGSILVVFVGSVLLASKTVKGAPSSHFHKKAAWTAVAGFTLYFLLLFMLVLPTSEKAAYTKNLEEAMNTLTKAETDLEFTVVKQDTETRCKSRGSSQRCLDWEYEHYFFIRNNLDVPKEVQVKFHIVTKNETKTLDSLIMKMKPGETRLVETEETHSSSSIWGKNTFTTPLQLLDHDYMYRFRDVE